MNDARRRSASNQSRVFVRCTHRATKVSTKCLFSQETVLDVREDSLTVVGLGAPKGSRQGVYAFGGHHEGGALAGLAFGGPWRVITSMGTVPNGGYIELIRTVPRTSPELPQLPF